jgi:hypothetical protein
MKFSLRSLSAVVVGAAVFAVFAMQSTVSASTGYRPPDMKKKIFDTKALKIDKFDRFGLFGALLSVARDFDDEDEVDYEVRSYALAIAGRLDKKSEKIKDCLSQLKEEGKTVSETAEKPRVSRRLYSGLRSLMRKKDNKANQKCAAYVADIALRFDPEGDRAEKITKLRDELKDAGYEADWKGILGGVIRHGGMPGEQQAEAVKPEVPMPGGTAKEFARLQGRINALVVRQLSNGAHAGATSTVNATALEEEDVKGLLFTFNQKVGPMMGGCLEEVVKFLRVRYAKEKNKIPEGYKIELGFQNKYQMKDGPSAATVFTLVLDSLFSGEELDDNFAATGDMTADGVVQKIGGVAAKIRGATKHGCKIVGIPAGNATGVADVLVMDGPEQLLDIQIFTMKDFDEAFAISRKKKSEDVQATLDAFASVVERVKAGTDFSALKDPAVQVKLQNILKRMPNHLSAKLLLDYGKGDAPTRLSVGGSFQEIDILSSGMLRQAMMMVFRKKVNINDDLRKEAKDSIKGLNKIAKIIDPRLKEYEDAVIAAAKLFVDGGKNGGSDEVFIRRINTKMEHLQSVRTKLLENPEIMEEITG